MKPTLYLTLIILGIIGMSFPAFCMPAFPGAVGFGATATGGMGGETFHVTTLADAGPGSFRDAVSRSRRVVVFDMAGEILLKSPVSVHSDLTLDGRATPGNGVCISGQEVSFSGARNVIVRGLRFRQGLTGNHHQAAIGMRGGQNIIFDHVSVSWGRWDTIDMNASTDITFQNCIIGPGINPQRFGCLCQSDNVTFTHCLWIDNQSRNPKAKGHIQFVNNVVYNWGVDGLVGGHSAASHTLDVIDNYFIKGPSSHDHFTGEYRATDQVYQSGNRVDMDRDGKLNGRPVVSADFGTAPEAPTLMIAPSLAPPIPVPSETPEQAYAAVISGAGALPRDSVDARLIAEVTSLGAQGKTIEDPAEMGGR